MTGVYHEMKIESGYSGEEIIGKSRSLKGVLEPFSTEGNREMLKRAGFEDVLTVMKHTCFEMFLAIK
jgi:tRNA (cmo5U34)-methyltransferase